MTSKFLMTRSQAALLLVSVAAACSDSQSVTDEPDPSTSTDATSSSSGATWDASGSSHVGSSDVGSGSVSSDGAASNGATSDSTATDSATSDGALSSDGGTSGQETQPDAQAPSHQSPLDVDLGSARDYVILAKTAISSVPSSAITGNVGVSPAAATYITGFSLTADPSNVFSLSPQVTGKVFAADYATPTPTSLTAAVSDMELAFADAARRAPDQSELGAGTVGGMSLAPGVYKWGTGLLVPSDIALAGGPDDVWIFQIAGDLNLSNGTHVALAGGALPRHVFWQVAGLVELGTTAHAEGVILCQTSITLKTGASLNGRLLAQAAVSLDTSSVVEPSLD